MYMLEILSSCFSYNGFEYCVKSIRIRVLQGLGRLQAILQGKCYSQDALNDKDFSPSYMIKGHKFLFRPEVKLKQSVAAGISLKCVSSEV